MDLATTQPAVDFVKELGDRAMFHVLDNIYHNLRPGEVAVMHQVCRAWNTILLDSGIGRRQKQQHEANLKEKVKRWRSITCGVQELVHLEGFIKCEVPEPVYTISHDLVFCATDEDRNTAFSVMRMDGQSVSSRKVLKFGSNLGWVLTFSTSCDYHKSELDRTIFITKHHNGVCLMWNLESGTSAEILPPMRKFWNFHFEAQKTMKGLFSLFTFNSEYLMVVWPGDGDGSLDILQLFKLNWTKDGAFVDKVLVDEVGGWNVNVFIQGEECINGKNILLLDEESKTGTMVTFADGKLTTLWKYHGSRFDVRNDDTLIMTKSKLFVFREPSRCMILDFENNQPVLVTQDIGPFDSIDPFGKIGVIVEWANHGGSLISFHELLEHGSSPESLMDSTLITFDSFCRCYYGGCRSCFVVTLFSPLHRPWNMDFFLLER